MVWWGKPRGTLSSPLLLLSPLPGLPLCRYSSWSDNNPLTSISWEDLALSLLYIPTSSELLSSYQFLASYEKGCGTLLSVLYTHSTHSGFREESSNGTPCVQVHSLLDNSNTMHSTCNEFSLFVHHCYCSLPALKTHQTQKLGAGINIYCLKDYRSSKISSTHTHNDD